MHKSCLNMIVENHHMFGIIFVSGGLGQAYLLTITIMQGKRYRYKFDHAIVALISNLFMRQKTTLVCPSKFKRLFLHKMVYCSDTTLVFRTFGSGGSKWSTLRIVHVPTSYTSR